MGLIYTGTIFDPAQPMTGLLPIVAVLFQLSTIYLGALVGMARARFGIPYPTMYAVAGTLRVYSDAMRTAAKDKGAAEPLSSTISEEEAHGFNCVQRGHQNAVENSPYVLLMLVCAAPFPIVAAVAGVVHIIGRVLYAVGYSRGAQSRMWGAVCIYPSLLTLLVLDILTAVYLFKGTQPY